MKDNKSSFMILISARIKDKPSKQTSFTKHSGYNARKVNCSCVYKNRCISVCLVSEEDKSNFLIILIIHIIVSFDQDISLIFMWKMDPMSGFSILLVFTLPPRDSTLQYKRCAHLWNNFPCIKTLQSTVIYNTTQQGIYQERPTQIYAYCVLYTLGGM